jgi:RNA polymerase-binding transcription factor DksA
MKDTSTYKATLEDEKKVLEAELESVGRRNPSNPADWEAVPQEVGQESDPNDRADLMEHLGENSAILNDLEIRYNLVLAAIDRIEKETYGICEVGKEEIEDERLSADPAAATCKAHMNG